VSVCNGFACDGVSQGCPTTCGSDGDCTSGYFCSSGACVTRYGNATACTLDAQCLSGFCRDGVCCNSDCAGKCQTCSDLPGLCSTAKLGATPRASCGAYLCDGAVSDCPNLCSVDAQCVAGDFCIFNVCTSKLPNGHTCASDADCANGFCTDGVCCDSRCTNSCYACNLTNTVGKCTQAAKDSDPRGLCAMMPGAAGCKARCGSNGFCQYPNATPCGSAASCVGAAAMTMLVPGQQCDGLGNCIAPPMQDCAPYVCSGNACPHSCIIGDDSLCEQPNVCAGSPPTCGGHQPNGKACARATDCTSGLCVDGVCCSTACDGLCQRCDQPDPSSGAVDGTCRAPHGDPDGECPGEGTCHGACQADFSCAWPGPEQACDTCKACNNAGSCSKPPASGDDPACLVIACGALSTECRTYTDLSGMRCVSAGLCAAANDSQTCTQFTNLPDGTPCRGGAGVCAQGTCQSNQDAGTTNAGGAGGCTLSPSRSGPLGAVPLCLLLLLLIVRRASVASFARARRRDRAAGRGRSCC
jgi:hypothetical protein